jgi:glycosyltransferase involved in cell wall biosynthesis
MIGFALEGVTSLSVKPLRFITWLGIILFLTSVVAIVYFFIRHFVGYTVSGWTSLACSVWGIGGLILFSIGIAGEYIGKIYLETKHRPLYHIEEEL